MTMITMMTDDVDTLMTIHIMMTVTGDAILMTTITDLGIGDRLH